MCTSVFRNLAVPSLGSKMEHSYPCVEQYVVTFQQNVSCAANVVVPVGYLKAAQLGRKNF